MPLHQGYTLFDGPSRINGKRIVVIATGFRNSSDNDKTGPMLQVFILVADEPPAMAIQTGMDASVCGGCKLGPAAGDEGRTCYVNVTMQGPASVYRAWRNGFYPALPSYEVFRGRRVRFGSYGDPAAGPLSIWSNIAQVAKGYTGYTHQWRSARLRDVTAYCMASCETDEDEQDALELGLSPYRIVQEGQPALDVDAMRCVNLDDGTQCYDCLQCNGKSGHTIYTIAHGTRGQRIETGALEVAAW